MKHLYYIRKKITSHFHFAFYKWALSHGRLWRNYIIVGSEEKIFDFLWSLEKNLCKLQVLEQLSYKCIARISAIELADEMFKETIKIDTGYNLSKRFWNRKVLILEDMDEVSHYLGLFLLKSVMQHWQESGKSKMLIVPVQKDVSFDEYKEIFKKIYFF